MRSFISNFRSLSYLRIFKSSIFWLILFSLLFDFFFFRSNYFYSLIPNSSTGQIEVISNRLIHAAEETDIHFLVLGDSQTRDGFNSELFAQNFGVNKDKVFNLSISSGEPIDMYNLYLRHRGKLKEVKFVVVGISEYQFRTEREPSQKFRRYATIIDRIQYTGPKADVILGSFSGAFDHREIWQNIIDLKRANSWPPGEPNQYRWGLEPITKKEEMDMRYRTGKERLSQWYGGSRYQISTTNTKYLEKLIKVLIKDEKKVFVVNTPKSTMYYKIREDLNRNTDFNVYKNHISDVCYRLGVPLLFYDDPWEDKYFRDINHLNVEGADLLIKQIYNSFRAKNPVE